MTSQVMPVYSLEKIQESLKVAESLAKASLMTSYAAKQRLAARCMEIGTIDEDGCVTNSAEYIPPKEILLYLVRMGSFTSSTKILNEDCQDHDVQFPSNFTRMGLIERCQNELIGLPPLLKRAFKYSNEASQCTSYKVDEKTTSANAFRVLQWNILSQSLGVMNDNFVCCPDSALDWKTRRYRILEEIVTYNPDVICLQEVDHFNFLKKALEPLGFDGLFYPKPDSPCLYINGNNGPDGCAIFFNTNKFELVQSESRTLEVWRVQSNQVALMTMLRLKESNREICVCTTHLKAKSGALLSTLRKEQGIDLLKFISLHVGNRALVLCGDFNAEPTEPIYCTMLNNPDVKLASAYANLKPGYESEIHTSGEREPSYTTWKIREEGEICHTIDYIFYTYNNLRVKSCLQFPSGEDLGPGRIPSFSYPSDHFSLISDFNLTDLSDEPAKL